MSSADHNPPAPDGPAPEDARRQPESAKLAHELANLLDGSLRNVGLVMSSLRGAEGALTDKTAEDDMAHRLETANHAMQQMARLIRRWMGQASRLGELHEQAFTLREAIDHALDLLRPAAAAQGIRLEVHVQPEAAELPAGPVYPIITNAVRNSIEAILQRPGGHGEEPADGGWCVEVHAEVADEQFMLAVRDNGPGWAPTLAEPDGGFRFGATTKPGGHGIGLTLARDIAQSLGGSIELNNRQPHGAEMAVRYPVASLYENADTNG